MNWLLYLFLIFGVNLDDGFLKKEFVSEYSAKNVLKEFSAKDSKVVIEPPFKGNPLDIFYIPPPPPLPPIEPPINPPKVTEVNP